MRALPGEHWSGLPPDTRARLSLAGASIAFFLAVVTLLALATTIDLARRGTPAAFTVILFRFGLGFAPWLFLSPLIFLRSRRDAAARLPPPRAIANATLLLAFCLAIAAAHIALVHAPMLGMTLEQYLRRIQVVQWTFDLFVFGLCVLAGRVAGERDLKERDALRRGELERRVLELQNERASLEARELKSRFSSHFMLNAMSNLLGLVRTGRTEDAEFAILALSEILKRVSRTGELSTSCVADEIRFINDYLRFQQLRFPRASVEIDVEDATRGAMVPAFLLQPLVENAFKHGLLSDGTMSAHLQVSRAGDALRMRLTNSAPAGRAMGADGEGVRLTRTRLELCFGGRYAFARRLEDGAHIVEISHPMEYA